jgi:hypothetical protein
MDKIIHFKHGETGIELTVVADTTGDDEIEIKAIIHKGENILPLVGDDLLVEIELYCGDALLN